MSRTAALLAGVVTAAIAIAVPVAASPHASIKAARYTLGADVESINPTAAMLADDFYLGGYGLGSGKVANQVKVIDGRAATGILRDPMFPDGLADGVHVRSVVIGDGRHAIALAQIETQGYYSAYKQGPFGITEIRKHAAAAIAKLHGPAMNAGAIVVDSNHSHSGPDTAGVWGGVPTTYLKLVHDQTVKAIVNAYRTQQAVELWFGTAHAGVAGMPDRYPSKDPLLTNQFSYDPANAEVDDELRVIQARVPGTRQVVATYLNYSSHPTVLGSENKLVSADYTGPLSAMLSTLGGVGMQQVATLGRTQPARDDCDDKSATGAKADVCKINQYAARVFLRARQAIAASRPLTGVPVVGMQSYLIEDTATNAPIIALEYGGLAAGAPLYRAQNTPWFTANEMGATVFSGRVGGLLLEGGPGEIYPQIVAKVRTTVPALGHFTIGTAGDFLGYIVAPVSAYPEPIRRSMFDGDPLPSGNPDCSGGAAPAPVPSPAGCPSPIDNDNYFFNVSHTFGERLTCAMLRGAGAVMKGNDSTYWSTYALCPAFANDYALPAGTDTQFPDQPDLSAVITH
ncbi:MAG: hypothetical protein JWL79_1852 [Frankiales bacterium]|nr:hypothetical protein [Frankiales bacterium]